jgi:hypothetical protein
VQFDPGNSQTFHLKIYNIKNSKAFLVQKDNLSSYLILTYEF